MTGTPLQNNTQELWSLLNFIEPRRSVSQLVSQSVNQSIKTHFPFAIVFQRACSIPTPHPTSHGRPLSGL